MVSFQCDACTDVVKKPKLDQHRVRCGASFTCIDCSKTFQTPVDWKGHTSCISEAEKYQKSLYKPKANGGGRENSYRNGSRGKFQGRGGPWGRLPPRSQATGANDTPLGTPTRMSPLIAPLEHAEKTDTAVVSPSTMEREQLKKDKKRRSEVTNIANVEGTDDPISREEPKSKGEKGGQKEKKEKKEKKTKKDKDDQIIASETGANGVTLSGVLSSPAVVVGDEVETKPKKEKKEKKLKKEKKERHELAIPQESTIDAACAASSLSSNAAGDDNSRNLKEKKKKKKTEKVGTGDAPNQATTADVPITDGEGRREKKKKKRKSEVTNDSPEVNGEVNATSASSETTSKKRKRETEEQGVTGQEVSAEKKKKKKTVAVS